MNEYRYEIDIYWSDSDRSYVAEVPELPGCAADGPTYGQALAAAEGAITVWIQTARDLGRPIPSPRDRVAQR
jgi:predicted RNase H-like HicB family nuclease